MNLREKILESQRDIINNLIDCEEAIAGLYEVYDAKLPELSGLWSTLAKEEHSHAAMLKVLQGYIDNGFLFTNIGGFNKDDVLVVRKRIATALEETEQDGFSVKTAFNAAISIESSIIDSKFYDEVASEAAEFKHVAEALKKATQKHLDRIRKSALHF